MCIIYLFPHLVTLQCSCVLVLSENFKPFWLESLRWIFQVYLQNWPTMNALSADYSFERAVFLFHSGQANNKCTKQLALRNEGMSQLSLAVDIFIPLRHMSFLSPQM